MTEAFDLFAGVKFRSLSVRPAAAVVVAYFTQQLTLVKIISHVRPGGANPTSFSTFSPDFDRLQRVDAFVVWRIMDHPL
jgi:hypothetical protein